MPIDRAIVSKLYRRADGVRWRLPEAAFAAALERSQAKSSSKAGPGQGAFFDGLHLEDLALACACAEGIDSAWEHFVLEFRPSLYRAADALDHQGGARELADSLYADLFGLREKAGERQSLFRYFHGRSSLATWLRAVLAQRFVDRHRAVRRLEPLPDDASASALPAASAVVEPERDRDVQLMTAVLTHALATLAPRDRLRLACYYAQELTLAQTGKLLGEHEATVSRQLARTRKAIREDLEQQLRVEHRLSPPEITRCFDSIAADAGPMDLRQLLTADDDRKEKA